MIKIRFGEHNRCWQAPRDFRYVSTFVRKLWSCDVFINQFPLTGDPCDILDTSSSFSASSSYVDRRRGTRVENSLALGNMSKRLAKIQTVVESLNRWTVSSQKPFHAIDRQQCRAIAPETPCKGPSISLLRFRFLCLGLHATAVVLVVLDDLPFPFLQRSA